MFEQNGPGEAPLFTARLGVTKTTQLHLMLPHAAGPRPGEFVLVVVVVVVVVVATTNITLQLLLLQL